MKLYPNAHFNKVEEITVEFLQKNEIKALILDIDNTLIDYKQHLSEKVINWAEELKRKEIKLYILSNTNNKEKVEKVECIKTELVKVDIPYFNLAQKPLKKGFLKTQKALNEKSENIGVIGDQIFTDIIGGNRCNMFTILVEPIDIKDYWYTAWKRPIENRIKTSYKKKNEIKN